MAATVTVGHIAGNGRCRPLVNDWGKVSRLSLLLLVLVLFAWFSWCHQCWWLLLELVWYRVAGILSRSTSRCSSAYVACMLKTCKKWTHGKVCVCLAGGITHKNSSSRVHTLSERNQNQSLWSSLGPCGATCNFRVRRGFLRFSPDANATEHTCCWFKAPSFLVHVLVLVSH